MRALDEKTALVTGAGRGLGRAMARALAREGARVLLTARSASELQAVAGEIAGEGGRAAAFAVDLTAAGAPEKAVEEAVRQFGRLDILVNNAGIAENGPSLEVDAGAWNRVLATNLTTPFLLAQSAGRRMMEAGGGKIINVASMFGLVGEPGMAAYCASKGGLIQLTKTLAAEWARYNIQVNAVAPGYFTTDMAATAIEDPMISAALLKRIPARRFGKPDELAPLVVYLASAASDYVTGSVMVIDGGQTAR